MASGSYQNWIDAFAIFLKYDSSESAQVAAQHEVIYAGPDIDNMSQKDIDRLEELGWDYDEQYGCFYRYT